jgi:hypothetical protein
MARLLTEMNVMQERTNAKLEVIAKMDAHEERTEA